MCLPKQKQPKIESVPVAPPEPLKAAKAPSVGDGASDKSSRKRRGRSSLRIDIGSGSGSRSGLQIPG